MVLTSADIAINSRETSKLSLVNWDQLLFGRTFTDHMFSADFTEGAWGNFRIEPYGPISIEPSLSALHYGQSIFEGLKAFRGSDGQVRVFRPEMNAKRLNASARRMCMAEVPESVFMEGLKALLNIDSEWVYGKTGYSLYLRPFLFATETYLGIKPSDSYRFMILASPVGAYYEGRIRVRVEQEYSRASIGGTGTAKAAGNYAASLYPALIGQKEGYRQLIWTDSATHTHIEESGTMNLFLVKNGALITPPLDSKTILAGVTRDSILALSRRRGWETYEQPISVDFLEEGLANGSITEVFGTGTAATVAGIECIGVRGKDYFLADLGAESRSAQLAAELSAIKMGEAPDSMHWNWTLTQ
jgi:branched-chain amino acid aminotransferase